MNVKAFKPFFLSVAFGVLFCSCQENSKAIKMKGSDTEVNLAVNLAETYSKIDPDFSIAISGGGSGMGITSLLNGQADIANSSRPLSDDEVQQFKEKDIKLLTVVFAEDATAFVVHQDFPLDEIDVPTLAKLLSGEVKNWSAVNGPNLPVNIYGRQSSSGTYSFVKKKLNIKFSNAAKEMTGNAQIIEGIKIDRSGIGYVGAGYVAHGVDPGQGIKVLKVKETPNSVAYSPVDADAINKNRYFFQRPLYQFILDSSWEKVKPFIDFEKSEPGKNLIKEHGYYILGQ